MPIPRPGSTSRPRRPGLRAVRELARATFTPGVLSEIGSFGGLFRPDLAGMREPVLVASADGVGTKLAVARMAGDYSTVGRDLVNHCVNDILVQGARPLFFLDYVGAGVLEPKKMIELVRGVADGCRENGCALLGGETAEMPGFYQPGDYELVGFIVGLADRAERPHRRAGRGGRHPARPALGGPAHQRLLAGAPDPLRPARPEAERSPARASSSKLKVGEWLLAPHLSYLAPLAPAARGAGAARARRTSPAAA